MIICHKYRFIFIKTNKTAGTSIEIALSKHCAASDIITPISSEDEQLRSNQGFRGPQNYLAPIWDYGVGDLTRFLFKGERKSRFYNHISAQDVKTHIGEEIWKSYFKFCFERNPWDRMISLYYWRYQSEPRPTISEFVESRIPLVLKRRGFQLYTINGKSVVDRICRYENISEELEAIRKKLGISEKLELPQAKSRFRKDRRSYRELFDEKQQAAIADLFSDEISLLGYEF